MSVDTYFDDVKDLFAIVDVMKSMQGPDKTGFFQITEKRLPLREGSPYAATCSSDLC